MRRIAALTLIALFACTAADARGVGGDYYTNSQGHQAHRPVHSTQAPRGATAKCRDGTYSFSENHRGTCSHHGGVAAWL